MIQVPKVGDTVWSFAPSLESQGYGPSTPGEPSQFKVFSVDLTGRPLVVIKAFNGQTGELDHDSNATCYTTPERIYATEAEALASYAVTLDGIAEGMAEEVDDLKRRARAARAKREEILSPPIDLATSAGPVP